MTGKFNPKQYAGKDRLYIAIPNAPRISRLWVWDAEEGEYSAPSQGKCYMVGRYESESEGKRKRRYQFFSSIDEGRQWQEGKEVVNEVAPMLEASVSSGPIFRDVIAEWRRRCFPRIAESTSISYENIIRLYFGSLLNLSIYEISPQRIDFWLDELKAPGSWTMKSRKRKTFKNELKLLSTILSYYGTYHDDPDFRFPIKKRHRLGIELHRKTVKQKDLGEDAFLKFRDALKSEVMAALATVQYYQALRISEAAALHWEDVDIDPSQPANSRLRIQRIVVWPRKKELDSFLQEGFKNSKANDGLKEQPVFPETFETLSKIHGPGARGLIFTVEGKHLEYRSIQSAYDRAFKKAGLPFSGTHVMRHGGCRRVYNQEGDLAVAQQLLGNSDLKSTLVYAKRNASALTEVAKKHWQKKSRLPANACNLE